MATSRVDGYRNQYRMAQSWLEGTVEGMTDEQFNFQPGGSAYSAGSNYLRHVAELDGTISAKLTGNAPLLAGTFSGSIGPVAPPQGDKSEWAKSTTFDMAAVREYGNAVYQATDDYLAGLSDSDLDSTVDLSDWGRGEQPKTFLLDLFILDCGAHTGEISAIKGVQGLKGYPF